MGRVRGELIMLMNYAEFRILVWATKNNLVVSYSIDTDSIGERYYEITAAEQQTHLTYNCKINSIDDAVDTADFEQKYIDLCNVKNIETGFLFDNQEKMIYLLEEVVSELKLLNARVEVMVESGIERDDKDSDDDSDTAS